MTDNKHRSQPPKLQTTDDGSHTLYSVQFDQHYHNPNGAVAESRHNFFEKNGLQASLPEAKSITILEIGFGTGLNLLLLLDEYLKSESKCKIDFYSVEGFPVHAKTARNFNYAEFLEHPELVEKLPSIFGNLQRGMNQFELLPNVTLHLFIGMFEAFQPDELQADYIFHDPFSPDVNEALWTKGTFKKLASWSSPDVILTTYSAASKARGAMAAAGWKIGRERGALGKREMSVASLNPDKLSHLKRVNENRLAHRYEINDF
ncbi:tRNA (5-methylaminomethyl-2-thiouridine)(34)-methyltransferase MnmD [Aliifodinibius sp. S!AR15-10]|uniref:tRNA (5-methylaminomethyl-2-thiouridine)(34)-methyltransferase MnmD n=1 Tax=Aliifodinibius sp. S!AR15-10 TaxID=2950437 RepID=UPI00285F318F|nr:tRNA (5-methylaminomethyl-2-thiouridine)(34)-methyltransferase MnmD [Aliifodinibius sp. S!AR15-10]MDR8393056.1 tRNA (5-methylaminomethyl-2-thiouridine)(34)-methyltransferase MnmD [Aliifodinibius sp. S!AR15-10]